MIRNRLHPTLLVVVLVLTGLPLLASDAAAAVGDLTPQGCIDDSDSGADSCDQSTEGLNDSWTVATSSDGTSVYAVGREDDAVVIFDRDTATGALTPAGCIDDNATATCAQSIDGLDGARGIAVSDDGESVYVVSDQDSALVIFDRDTATGALTPAGCIDDNDSGGATCAQSANGLTDGRAIAVSSDGTSVYAVGLQDDAVVVFDRDTSSGALTPAGCIDDNDSGPESCSQSTDGLTGVRSLTVSDDGQSVFAVSLTDDAIVVLDRDTQTGALTPAGCIDDNDTGIDTCSQSTDGLAETTGVAVSPDGASVYAVGRDDAAVVTFDRNAETGALTPAGCIDDNDIDVEICSQSTNGLAGARSVAVSDDGKSVYVAAYDDGAVAIFERDVQSGALTPDGCIDDNDTGADTCSLSTDGLSGATFVAISSDGRSVYLVSSEDDAVIRFDREVDGGSDTDPPETTIKGPGKTTDRRPKFRLGSDEPGSTFACKLDKKPYKACTSPYRTPKLSRGKHVLKVRATDAAGNTDPSPAKKTFKIVKKD